MILACVFIQARSQSVKKVHAMHIEAVEKIITYTKIPTKFKVIASTPEMFDVIRYEWDFDGDGKSDMISKKPRVSHVYKKSGKYTAMVTAVWDDYNNGFTNIRVEVKKGKGKQENISVSRLNYNPVTKARTLSIPEPDGIKKHYAIMFNGGSEDWFWTDVEQMYATLKNVYDYSDDEIFLYNSDDSKSNVDNNASKDSLEKLLCVYLPNIIDREDQLLIWITDHGGGYRNSVTSNFNNYVLGTEANVIPGGPQNYSESDFDYKAMATGGQKSSVHGLGDWHIYYNDHFLYEGELRTALYRRKFVSHYDLFYKENGDPVSADNDVFIEELIDYFHGDTDKDGVIDSGENLDTDGDGNPAFDPMYNTVDEGDWCYPGYPDRVVDQIVDNFNYVSNRRLPGDDPFGVYILFDKNKDNKLDIDILPSNCDPDMLGICNISTLVADATDVDNDGIFDGFDVNQDGDKNDWITVYEGIYTSNNSKYIMDYELEQWLSNIECGNRIVVMQNCFSGGFVYELSDNKTCINTACVKNETSHGNDFIRLFEDATASLNLSDADNSGLCSMKEAFNYAAGNDPNPENPQYDDNGDGVGHTDPIPNGGDGDLGSILFLSYENFCPAANNKTLSGNVSGTYKQEGAKYNITSTQNIYNQSNIIYVAGSEINLNEGFEVALGSEFEIIMEPACD